MKEYWDLTKQKTYTQSYCGDLDLVNGTLHPEEMDSRLKFQALFYEKIIVPDSFIHCRGPMSAEIIRFKGTGEGSQNRTLPELLRAGILVPTLRQGTSLIDNWRKGVGGIIQTNMVLSKAKEEHNEDLLEFVERNSTTYAKWPKHMASSLMPEYSSALHVLFFGDDTGGSRTVIDRESLSGELGLSDHPNIGWHRLFEAFKDAVIEQEHLKHFRRGKLEEAIVRHFRWEGNFQQIYDCIREGRNNCDSPTWPEFAVADYLLRTTATVYEAYQAKQFNSVGNLFQNYARPVVNAPLYSRLCELQVESPSSAQNVVPPECLNLTRIPIEQILEFRKSRVSEEYRRDYLQNLQPPSEAESFVCRNAAFYKFLQKTYVPAIVEKLPHAINAKRIKNVGSLVGWTLSVPSTWWAARYFPDLHNLTSLHNLTTLGIPLFAFVAWVNSQIKSNAGQIAEAISWPRNRLIRAKAAGHINAFIAQEKTQVAPRPLTEPLANPKPTRARRRKTLPR